MVGQDVFNCINKSKQIAYIELPPLFVQSILKNKNVLKKLVVIVQ